MSWTEEGRRAAHDGDRELDRFVDNLLRHEPQIDSLRTQR